VVQVREEKFPAQRYSPYQMLKGEKDMFQEAMKKRGDAVPPLASNLIAHNVSSE